ncbi:MAG: lipase family alpha/beta hydrolase [Dehalococcoidia bacterium]
MNSSTQSSASASGRRTETDGSALADLAVRAWQPAAEFSALLRDPVYWGWGVPRGDGHAVLVLPGLLAGDRYLQPLRGWLRRIGYTSVRSGIDRNPGWSEDLVRELGEIAQRESDRSGKQVTIIGHSMGGILGRSIAGRRPGIVRHVITLGSPLGMSRSRLPVSVRLTAMYSRDDQIVRYPGALARDPNAQNIEVHGSHTGLAGNAEVYRQIARLLPPKPNGFV